MFGYFSIAIKDYENKYLKFYNETNDFKVSEQPELEYLLEDKKYLLSYQNLKEDYYKFCNMPDEEFLQNLPSATHLACVICYLKELPTYVVLCDIGIIHELIHLTHIPDSTDLKSVRKLFEQTLKLE